MLWLPQPTTGQILCNTVLNDAERGFHSLVSLARCTSPPLIHGSELNGGRPVALRRSQQIEGIAVEVNETIAGSSEVDKRVERIL